MNDSVPSQVEAQDQIRDLLTNPIMQKRYILGEAGNVDYAKFAIGPQEPIDSLQIGQQIISRVYDRVFWLAPNSGVMDNLLEINAVLHYVSSVVGSDWNRVDRARHEDGGLKYGRLDVWQPYRCLNTEVVVLPHRSILEMLQNYYSNKESIHPSQVFENARGLGFGVNKEQLQRLHEQESKIRAELRGTKFEHLNSLAREFYYKARNKER